MSVVHAKAGTHNPDANDMTKRIAGCAATTFVPQWQGHGVWVPAFAGTTAEFGVAGHNATKQKRGG